MTKFRIEVQIALIALVIGTAVFTAGYLAYESMTQIVSSIHREARPDNRLFLIKDINTDLESMENKVRLYILTDNVDDLMLFDTLLHNLTYKLNLINALPAQGNYDSNLTDSIRTLALEKQELWQGILALHQTAEGVKPTFTKIYSKLEQQKNDTIITEKEKKGLLKKIFGSKKTAFDTIIKTRLLESDEVKREIRILESEIQQEGRSIKAIESQLIGKNIVLTARLNNLVAKAEQRKATELIEKSIEVDRLALMTYKQLAVFIITAMLLLVIALLVLFSYLKRSRAYQEALHDARQKAENLAHAKEQFIANVSHELRTPVNAIFGLTEQALQRISDPETKEMVTIISKSSEHLKNIINDTLDFSKIEAGKIVFESVDFSPSEICREVLSIQKFEAKKKGISLNFIPEENLPGAFVGDPLRLKQILINLVGNAVKFTEEGSVNLYLAAKDPVENRFRLVFTVEDTGIGMTENNLQIVFDEFVQAKNPAGKKQSGTGLGLSIVKKLVEMQGGDITVKSTPGKGTRIRVEIPYQEGNQQNIVRTGQAIRVVPGSLRELSVLVADDDEYNTFLLRNILKKWGVRFMETRNGKEAVEASQNHFFDIILMDVHMPEMDGPEAARIIKGKFPDTKIIAVTATNDPNDQLECKKSGMDHILIKPFSEKELLDILLESAASETADIVSMRPPVNIGELGYLTNGDNVFLCEMIELFITSTASALDEIQNAISHNDLKTVFENTHKMAAPCKQIQANKLYGFIKQLEGVSRKGDNKEAVITLFQSVNAEMSEVHAYLRKYLDEIKS